MHGVCTLEDMTGEHAAHLRQDACVKAHAVERLPIGEKAAVARDASAIVSACKPSAC